VRARFTSGVREGAVESARLEIFEAPRYFERLVVGRSMDEVIDIVARICGICPVAYQMTAVHAAEAAFGIEVDPATVALRRLLYCGEMDREPRPAYLLCCICRTCSATRALSTWRNTTGRPWRVGFG
jgi:Ni,Fe-hydrogenase III large subunit